MYKSDDIVNFYTSKLDKRQIYSSKVKKLDCVENNIMLITNCRLTNHGPEAQNIKCLCYSQSKNRLHRKPSYFCKEYSRC